MWKLCCTRPGPGHRPRDPTPCTPTPQEEERSPPPRQAYGRSTPLPAAIHGVLRRGAARGPELHTHTCQPSHHSHTGGVPRRDSVAPRPGNRLAQASASGKCCPGDSRRPWGGMWLLCKSCGLSFPGRDQKSKGPSRPCPPKTPRRQLLHWHIDSSLIEIHHVVAHLGVTLGSGLFPRPSIPHTITLLLAHERCDRQPAPGQVKK